MPREVLCRWASSSGLLGSGREDNGGRETVHTEGRYVDLVGSVGGELEKEVFVLVLVLI